MTRQPGEFHNKIGPTKKPYQHPDQNPGHGLQKLTKVLLLPQPILLVHLMEVVIEKEPPGLELLLICY